jgi:acylphosphatase
MSELAYVSATIYGHVQGVFYRAFASRVAKALGLKGYVRNLPQSGVVEIHAEGNKEKLEELIKQLEVGPPEALVEKIDVNWSEFSGKFSNFEAWY